MLEISESQLVLMVMFNPMTKNKVYCTVPLTQTVVLLHLHMTIIKFQFSKSNVAANISQ